LVVRGLGRVPGAITALGQLGRLRSMRRLTLAIAPLTVNPIADELVRDWIAPLRDRGVRRDLRKVLLGIAPEHTLAAAEQLRSFDRPALIVWGMADRFFPFADAERLAAALPHASIERVENARTFVQLDAPDRLAQLIARFAAAGASAGEPSRT
jgi:pimeloyl-ACP methyl ester carboxylesterase